MVYKLGVLKNVAKYKRKHLCWIHFFNDVADLQTATLLKRDLQYKCFSVNFSEKCYRTSLLQNSFKEKPCLHWHKIIEGARNPLSSGCNMDVCNGYECK